MGALPDMAAVSTSGRGEGAGSLPMGGALPPAPPHVVASGRDPAAVAAERWEQAVARAAAEVVKLAKPQIRPMVDQMITRRLLWITGTALVVWTLMVFWAGWATRHPVVVTLPTCQEQRGGVVCYEWMKEPATR